MAEHPTESVQTSAEFGFVAISLERNRLKITQRIVRTIKERTEIISKNYSLIL